MWTWPGDDPFGLEAAIIHRSNARAVAAISECQRVARRPPRAVPLHAELFLWNRHTAVHLTSGAPGSRPTCRRQLTCREVPTHDLVVPDDAVFLALAHPVRRRLLQILAGGPQIAGELAEQFDLSRPAVAEHLQVLRRAALVRDEQVGRRRRYHLTAEPLAEVEDWLHPFEHFWRARLRSLSDIAEENT